jgi:hypothetical protein
MKTIRRLELLDPFYFDYESLDKQDLTFYQLKVAHQRFGKKEYKTVENKINGWEKNCNGTQRKELSGYFRFKLWRY